MLTLMSGAFCNVNVMCCDSLVNSAACSAGTLCCWCERNPTSPSVSLTGWYLRCFSAQSPNLRAGGLVQPQRCSDAFRSVFSLKQRARPSAILVDSLLSAPRAAPPGLNAVFRVTTFCLLPVLTSRDCVSGDHEVFRVIGSACSWLST
jgi:hypothetical protein